MLSGTIRFIDILLIYQTLYNQRCVQRLGCLRVRVPERRLLPLLAVETRS